MKKIEKIEILGFVEELEIEEAVQNSLNDIYQLKVKLNEIIDAINEENK